MGIHIKSWQLTARKSNPHHNLNQGMEQHIWDFIISCWKGKVLNCGKIWIPQYSRNDVLEAIKIIWTFPFSEETVLSVTHQYHQHTIHKSASKQRRVYDIWNEMHPSGLHGNKASKKIEQVLAMILRRIMVPLHEQLPRWNQMLWACALYQSK